MEDYLRATEILDYNHPDVQQLATDLAGSNSDHALVARSCFEWVRQLVDHGPRCASHGLLGFPGPSTSPSGSLSAEVVKYQQLLPLEFREFLPR